MYIIYIVLVVVAFIGGYLWGRVRREKPESIDGAICPSRPLSPYPHLFKGKSRKIVDKSVSPQKVMLDRMKNK